MRSFIQLKTLARHKITKGFSVIVPVKKQQTERHHQQEEQNVDTKTRISLNRLFNLFVGFANIFSGTDNGVGDSFNVTFLQGNLRKFEMSSNAS